MAELTIGLRFYSHVRLGSDASNYFQIATNVANGKGFSDHFPEIHTTLLHATAWRPPLYPLVLAVAFLFFCSHIFVAQIVNSVISFADSLLIYSLVVQAISEKFARSKSDWSVRFGGISASLIFITYPPLFSNTFVPLSEPLLLLLLLLAAKFYSKHNYFLMSATCGLLVLTKPGTEVLVVITLLLILKKAGVRKAAKCLALVVLIVLPWILRNYFALGAPVMETSDGFNLASEYSSFSQSSNSFVDPVFDPKFRKYWPLQNNEVKWDHQLAILGINNIDAHPTVIAKTFKRNIEIMFQLRPQMAVPAETSDLRHIRLINDTLPWYIFVSLMGLIFISRMKDVDYIKYFLFMASWDTFSGLFSSGAPRLRASFDLAACIGFGFALYYFLQKAEASRRKPNQLEPSNLASTVPS